MAILNYTTSIDCEKSIGEIQKCLVKHGAHKIVTDYHNGLPSAVTFCLTINDKQVCVDHSIGKSFHANTLEEVKVGILKILNVTP